MTDPRRLRPVPRGRVLAVALVIGAALVAIGGLAEWLRHPLPSGGPPVPEIQEPQADPRFDIECAEPTPREGQERDESQPNDGTPRQVTSNALYDCPQVFDGLRVRYRGEVVGAVLRRREGAWVQLNDDVYAETLGPLPAHRDYRGGNAGVGVFITHELADRIAFVGGPQSRGDILEITGVFQRVDEASAEASIIRAEGGRVAGDGEPFVDPVLPDRRAVAVALAAVAAATTLAERVVARRR